MRSDVCDSRRVSAVLGLEWRLRAGRWAECFEPSFEGVALRVHDLQPAERPVVEARGRAGRAVARAAWTLAGGMLRAREGG